MKIRIIAFLVFLLVFGFSLSLKANGVSVRPIPPKKESPVQIIGWDPRVPLQRILDSIREGVTDQLTILRLFSAPNIISRSDHEKETWIYHWKWSYNNTKSLGTTLISMDHPGLRLKSNKRPVSMVVTFNDKNIVESYAVRLLKVKKDSF